MRKGIMLYATLAMLVLSISSAGAYDIPQRKIEIKPYVNILFPKDFVTFESGVSYVDDEAGFGGGVKIRTQLTGPFGFMINASVIGVERSFLAAFYNRSSAAVLFTGGFYYTFETSIGNISLDCGYGVIEICGAGLALFMPSVEYSYPVSDRISLAAELSMPVPNDWYSDWDHNSNAKSLMLSVGSVILF